MADQFVEIDQVLAQVVHVRGADAQLRKQGDDRGHHDGHRVHASTFRTEAPGEDDIGDG